MTMKRKRIKPEPAYAAISAEEPPNIWYFNWNKEGLPEYLKHIRVMVVPLADYRRIVKASRKAKGA